jgi:uncharacterized protein (DUF924 family)
MPITETPQAVLDFWFGAEGTPERGRPRDVWFKKSVAFDHSVRSRFLQTYERAAARELDAWGDAPQTLLALIIVLDQFPRNMFRGDARAFATDAQALAAAERMVARGWDAQLAPIERSFAYLPYEHAEDLAMQERSLELFNRLADETGSADAAQWAQKHHAVIARFGRFPHRNRILARSSTPEEIEFLAQPGSSF